MGGTRFTMPAHGHDAFEFGDWSELPDLVDWLNARELPFSVAYNRGGPTSVVLSQPVAGADQLYLVPRPEVHQGADQRWQWRIADLTAGSQPHVVGWPWVPAQIRARLVRTEPLGEIPAGVPVELPPIRTDGSTAEGPVAVANADDVVALAGRVYDSAQQQFMGGTVLRGSVEDIEQRTGRAVRGSARDLEERFGITPGE